MKKWFGKNLFYVFFTILFVLLCACTTFLLVKVHYCSKEIYQLKNQLSELYKNNSISNVTYNNDIITQVSIFISICSAAITLFGLFGGILSFVNLHLGKELNDDIKNANKALENQEELKAWRLIQEGRNYKSLKRFKYAEEVFEEVIKEYKDSELSYIAEFEKLSLYEECIISAETKDLQEIIDNFETFYKQIKNNSKLKNIKIEVLFFLGGLYGDFSRKIGKEDNSFKEYINKSISYFESAIKLDPQNPDLYRNASISYALSEQKDACIDYLCRAKRLSKNEILYKSLVTSKRLSDMYKSYSTCISDEIKQTLSDKFYVFFTY